MPIRPTFERAAKNFLTARKDGHFADVAQWQRNRLVSDGLKVQILSSAPVAGSLPADVGVAQFPTENDNGR